MARTRFTPILTNLAYINYLTHFDIILIILQQFTGIQEQIR